MRLDALHWHVMDAMADDVESLVQIVPHVDRFLDSMDAARIAESIRRLVDVGYVATFVSRGGFLVEAKGLVPKAGDIVSDPDGYWFAMTAEGRAEWDSQGQRYRFD